ncbi:MAG: glycosyltransferase [Rhizobium sp.]|nr:glycosyltransferase [Rhizobium sp.]
MSRVSIVIPCYNAGDLLREAVDSALAQTHADTEVVVVDDGSTDPRTAEVLASLADPRVTVIRQANAGPAAARNRAIAAATGEFILPLDADDRFDPTYAAKALAEMQRDPALGIVYCDAMKFGAETGIWRLPAFSLREMAVDNVVFCSSLFRKADWAAVGGYRESLRHGMEDYEFWLRILSLGRGVAKIPEPLFFYRIQERSRTTQFMEHRPNVVATYAEIFRANLDFFARHAEVLFEHRFQQYRELDHFRYRYGKLDQWIEKRGGWIKRFAQFVRRRL